MLKIVWVVYNVDMSGRAVCLTVGWYDGGLWDVSMSISNIFCSILWNQWSGCPVVSSALPVLSSQWCVTSHIGNDTVGSQPEIREFVFRLQFSLKNLIKHWLYCQACRLHLLSLPSCWAITKQSLDGSEWAELDRARHCWKTRLPVTNWLWLLTS